MRKFLWLTLLCAGLAAASCSDKDDNDGDGPAGSVEMLYGTWGISHMYVEAMGQNSEMDVDASISTITFRSDGTATEKQEGVNAYATWSYNPSSRILHIKDSNFDIEYDWYVKSLTDEQLIVDFTMTEEGVSMRMVMTYNRISRASSVAPASVSAASDAPVRLLRRAQTLVEPRK
ncbi:lipocalin family protein [Alistipes sp.]|uniref:lipocalin family protein n=1 Tax=Alistipes sp. TaxID=1872444 RepID=UPI003AF0C653